MCKDKISQDTMFGIKNGKVIHISEVPVKERGLKCNCYCVKCGQPLIARLGEVKEHHFAHHSKCNCNGSVETALHLFAKEVLERNKRLVLPKLSVLYYIEEEKVKFHNEEQQYYWIDTNEYVFLKEGTIDFDKVDTEYVVGDIIADAILYRGERPLIVEVKVTHEVDSIKAKKVKDKDISTIEIDLSKKFENYYEFDRETVEDIIVNDTSIKQWVYHVNYEEYKKRLKAKLEQKLQEKLKKEREENEKKMKYMIQRHDEKVEKIRMLMDLEYQNALRVKWDKELNQDSIWLRECRYLGITKDTVPEFLNKELDGELVFNCDRRIWQTKIFDTFIYRWTKRKQVIKSFSVEYLVEWVKKKSGLPLNEPLIYTRDVEDEFPNIKSLSDVLFEFLLNLSNYNFVKPSDRSLIKKGNPYYWWFDKLDENISNDIVV